MMKTFNLFRIYFLLLIINFNYLFSEDSIYAEEKILLNIDALDFDIENECNLVFNNEQLIALKEFNFNEKDTFDLYFHNLSSKQIDYVLKFLKNARIEKLHFENCLIYKPNFDINYKYLEELVILSSSIYNFDSLRSNEMLKKLKIEYCNEINPSLNFDFEKYPNLRYLSISNVNIIFSNNILNLKKLEFLNLWNVYINFNDYFIKSNSLKELYLQYIKDDISKLNINEMINLENIYLSNTGIKDYNVLFKKISTLKNLKQIELEYENINIIPDLICNLNNLSKIVINNTFIESLPTCFENLSNLKTLEIRNSNLKLDNNFRFPQNLDKLEIYNTYTKKSDLDSSNLKHIKSVSVYTNR